MSQGHVLGVLDGLGGRVRAGNLAVLCVHTSQACTRLQQVAHVARYKSHGNARMQTRARVTTFVDGLGVISLLLRCLVRAAALGCAGRLALLSFFWLEEERGERVCNHSLQVSPAQSRGI